MSKTSFTLAYVLVVFGSYLNHNIKAQVVILNREKLAEWVPDYATQTQIFLSCKSIS